MDSGNATPFIQPVFEIPTDIFVYLFLPLSSKIALSWYAGDWYFHSFMCWKLYEEYVLMYRIQQNTLCASLSPGFLLFLLEFSSLHTLLGWWKINSARSNLNSINPPLQLSTLFSVLMKRSQGKPHHRPCPILYYFPVPPPLSQWSHKSSIFPFITNLFLYCTQWFFFKKLFLR